MNNSPKTIALSFDVELWTEGEWMQKYITPDMQNRDMLIESIEQILNILGKKNFRATFFVTDEVLKKYPECIKKISDHGHEVGSHSVRHTQLRNIKPEEFERLFREHSALIEKVTGKKPKGFRAPHFSLEKSTQWLIPVLEQNALKYDSSIFPMKTGSYGVADSPLDPYQISPNLTEIPLTIYSNKYLKFPIAGGLYFRLLPYFMFKGILKRAIRRRQLPIIYFHPHELYAQTPQIKGPFLKTFLKYYGVSNSFKKFEKLTEDFSFDSIENLVKL